MVRHRGRMDPLPPAQILAALADFDAGVPRFEVMAKHDIGRGALGAAVVVRKRRPDLWEKVVSGEYAINRAWHLMRGHESKDEELHKRRERIAAMIEKGFDLYQIAAAVGVKIGTLRNLIIQYELDATNAINARGGRRARKPRLRRAVEETVQGLCSYALSIGAMGLTDLGDEFGQDEAKQLADAISETLPPIHKLWRALVRAERRAKSATDLLGDPAFTPPSPKEADSNGTTATPHIEGNTDGTQKA